MTAPVKNLKKNDMFGWMMTRERRAARRVAQWFVSFSLARPRNASDSVVRAFSRLLRATMLSLAALVVLSALSSSSRALSFPSFSSLFPSRTPRFTPEKLIDLASLGLPKTGTVAAWGDFDSDQFLDLFYLSYDQRSISVWTWDRKLYAWNERTETVIKTKGDFVVTNVVPGDFNRDGRLDLLVMGEQHPGWSKETDMLVYLQTPNGTFGEYQKFSVPPASFDAHASPFPQAAEPESLDPASVPQPIPLDATGTMTTSLFGFSPSSTPQLWLNTAAASSSQNASAAAAVFETTDASNRFDYSSHPSGDWTCTSPSPHSNQFLDLDGDCLADVFLTCLGGKNGDDEDHLRYEIWVNEKRASLLGGDEAEGDDGRIGRGGKFVWKRGGDLPKGTRSVSFADMGTHSRKRKV